MQIDKEYIESLEQNIEVEKTRLSTLMQQANGMLGLIRVLKQRLDESGGEIVLDTVEDTPAKKEKINV